MQEIAGMARKPRQRWRDAHDARGRSATARAQLSQMFVQREPGRPAQLDFAISGATADLAEPCDRPSSIVRIEDSDPPDRVDGNEVQRQSRNGTQPARAITAVSVEQRRPHDRERCATHLDRPLAT